MYGGQALPIAGSSTSSCRGECPYVVLLLKKMVVHLILCASMCLYVHACGRACCLVLLQHVRLRSSGPHFLFKVGMVVVKVKISVKLVFK